jgi:hypothetical protein
MPSAPDWRGLADDIDGAGTGDLLEGLSERLGRRTPLAFALRA